MSKPTQDMPEISGLTKVEYYRILIREEHHFVDILQRRVTYHTTVLLAVLAGIVAVISDSNVGDSELDVPLALLGFLLILLASLGRAALKNINALFRNAIGMRENMEDHLGLTDWKEKKKDKTRKWWKRLTSSRDSVSTERVGETDEKLLPLFVHHRTGRPGYVWHTNGLFWVLQGVGLIVVVFSFAVADLSFAGRDIGTVISVVIVGSLGVLFSIALEVLRPKKPKSKTTVMVQERQEPAAPRATPD